MATFHPRIGSGYRGGNNITIDPTAYAAQQERSRQADIRARAEAAQLLARQKAEAQAAEDEARNAREVAANAARFSLHQSTTNAAWNKLMAEQAAKQQPKPIKVIETDKDTGRKVERTVPAAQFDAEEKAKKISALTTQRDLLKNEWQMPFGLSRVPGKLASVESELAAANAPTDLLTSPTRTATSQVVAAPAPTPQGFIGSPGANTFLATPQPLGMNRAQTNAYAIDLNNKAAPAPRDLLTSESFPSGYDPGHGSFQMDAVGAPEAEEIQVAPEADPAAAEPAPAPSAKIVIQNGNRFRLNPDGSAEHIGAVETR